MSNSAEPGPAFEQPSQYDASTEVTDTFETPITELIFHMTKETSGYTDEQDLRAVELLKQCLDTANELFQNENYFDCYFRISEAVQQLQALGIHDCLCDAIDLRRQLDKMTGGLKGRVALVSSIYFQD